MKILKKTVAFLLTLGTVSSVTAAQVPVPDEQLSAARDRGQAEGRQDPPGVLNQRNIKTLKQLAAKLSSDRSWLTNDILKGFDTMSLRLDEVFAAAPMFMEIDGELYRLELEKVGPGWKSFKPDSKYLVFLSHEAYDALGENYALAFEGGKERIIDLTDIEKTAAIGLTLRNITPSELPKGLKNVVDLDSEIKLGKVSRKLRTEREFDIRKMLAGSAATESSCSYISAPIGCSNGVPVCASGSATPYFMVSGIRIRIDSEGAFKGNPETELFPMRINPNSPVGGSNDLRTTWIFDGRYVTDTAGRYVYLPDVNNTWQWYTISDGVAVFPSSLSNEWVGTLVENDDTTGKLELDSNKSNRIKLPIGAIIAKIFDGLDFLKGFNLVISLGFLNDSDDLWQPSLAFDNNLFCSSGVGQPFPYTYTLYGEEWDMQGHFACIDPSCVPDPCGGDPCCGDPYCGGGGCGPYGCP